MVNDKIIVKGARTHNLKALDIEIPRNQFVVMTGLSGSGKSSLAFDTIYAEGQRRYVESLSAYARQFLGQMDKPDVDTIEGLSPAISIDQKTTNRNPRSTVATVTEIYDYLRLLYARIGVPYCPNHNVPIQSQTVQQMVDQVMILEQRTKIQILSPLINGKKGQHKQLLQQVAKQGYARVRINGEIYDIEDTPELNKNKKHHIDVIVDRLVIKEEIETRLSDSIQTALQLAEGNVIVNVIDGEDMTFSEHFACPDCGFSIDKLEPSMFSFNSPFGACESCDGLGHKMSVNVDKVIPDPSLSIEEGAIVPWQPISSNYYPTLLQTTCKHFNINLNTPFNKLSKKQQDIILYGHHDEIEYQFEQDNGVTRTRVMAFEGVVNNIERRYRESPSEYTRTQMEKYMDEQVCKSCNGYRLNDKVLAVKINGHHIGEITEMSIRESLKYFLEIELSAKDEKIAELILKEIRERLGFLNNVGLEYLTLDRMAGSLSGGEAQRIRLATQIGSRLSGVLYVLDEPSIGLHQKDNDKLIQTLKEMTELGNTLIVVEHDEDTMRASDYLIDIGPGAGIHGGQVVAQGTPDEVMAIKESITGQYLSGEKSVETPKERRKIDKYLTIEGATQNNLKNVTVDIPLNVMTVVTGVSGSGKSTLVNEILYKSLANKLYKNKSEPGQHKQIKGLDHIEKVIEIDQAPIGRTPRSNPATYTSVFDDIRHIFQETNEAKLRGYNKGRFSFNVKGGRCEACRGDGIIKIEMHFLPDVYVPCEVCHGTRYNRETLEITYKDKNIADVLNMTVEEALAFFENIPKIKRKIQTLYDVGLGYITLGQSATTLSGGEAQRIKLAAELQKRSDGKSVYIMDEPTTGLHVDDINRLLKVIQRLVDQGDTVVIIEHNLDVIKSADYIIDLGPEGGIGGGEVIATGTPEEIVNKGTSHTGRYLKPYLNK
ncbi:excinuclease ABC subunit UvrA [Abyssicoccus albus]|uniref:excinuclease ABC subunit UvrA n=1 Tax=Abyssicoccus albus TaxID=1817405 RepID=UPI00097E1CD5|nr:excinuclease ABC subunit UvrA [Abyssicoccus albus]AQL56696.1 excinuclease ABC subunit A [Abyssicoccus albus]